MSDTERRWDDKLRINLARLLRQIEHLTLDLHTQALADPNARDFPGGRALNMLAPAAVLQDWEAVYEAKEEAENGDQPRWANRAKLDPAIDQVAAEEQPLNVLTFWTRVIREELDEPTALKPTVSREVDYLRKKIDWMTRADTFDEPAWMEAFEIEKDLRALVRMLEDVLRAGDRIDTDAAPCFQLDPDGVQCGGTLARVNLRPRPCIHATFAATNGRNLGQVLAGSPSLQADHKQCDQGGRDDLYRCLKCEKKYTTTEYWLAVSENHERQAG